MAMQKSVKTALRAAERAFKLRYMGIGFAWAWLYCSYGSSALFADQYGFSINADGSWLVSAATVIVAFLVGGVWLRSMRPRAVSPLTVGAPVALAVGTVLSMAGSYANPAALWTGGILTGAGYALLSILWAIALFKLEVEELEVAIPLSTLVTVVCCALVPALEGLASALTTAALPLVSGALLILCLSSGPSEDGVVQPREDQTPSHASSPINQRLSSQPWFRYLLRASILLGVLYFATGWEAASEGSGEAALGTAGMSMATLAGNCATVVLVILMVLFSRRVSFGALFRWVMPMVVVSLVLKGVALPWASFVSVALVTTGDTLMEVTLYLFVLTVAKTQQAPVSLGVGLANGFIQMGVLAGNLAGRACLQSGDPVTTGGFLAALVCLVTVATIFVPQREPGNDAPALETPDARMRSMLESCRILQARYGLSDRETEIAALVAQGRSRPYIRERLFISANTVATHIKHIYQKLDIHSREELIDLVESASTERP